MAASALDEDEFRFMLNTIAEMRRLGMSPELGVALGVVSLPGQEAGQGVGVG